MIRNLLATTAIATLLATGAMAQSSTTTSPSPDAAQPTEELNPAGGAATTQEGAATESTTQPADSTAQDSTAQPADTTAQDSTTTLEPAEETAQDTEMQPAEDTAQTTITSPETQAAGENPPVEGQLASNLIGSAVYNGVADDAETIGDVSDVVIGNDGKAEYVVIGVGGFLGIGQKDVAIEYTTLQWAERDGEMLLVVEATQEQLEQQPAFDRTAYDPEAMAAQQQAADQQQQPAGSGMATQPAAGGMTATAPATTGQAMEPEEQQAETTTTTVPVEETEETAAAPAEQPDNDATTVTTTETAEAPAEGATTTTETTDAPAAGAATDATQTAAIDRSTLQETDMGSIQAENFIGTTVYGANEEQVGEIGDVILTQDGQVDAVIVDVGGFLGMGEKQVAVGMDNLQFMQDADGNMYLYTNWTQEQLEAQPAYEEATYAENRETMRLIVEQN